MPRWGWVARGISVALLLGCVLSGVALAARGEQAPGDGRPAATAVIPSAASHDQVRSAIASGRLLFVGASYTVGLGATAPSAGYAPVLASDLERRFTVAAVSGTGFLNPGPRHQGTFAQRIASLPSRLDPRIVVIQGGRNDQGYPQPALQAAVRQTITLAQHRYSHAQVVVMGPIPATVPVNARLLQTRNIVRAGARQTGAGFVDPIAQGWITKTNERAYAGPVPAHPNDAGYRYIAGRLLADLPAALDASRPPLSSESAPSTPATTTSAVPSDPPAEDAAGRSEPQPSPAATVGADPRGA